MRHTFTVSLANFPETMPLPYSMRKFLFHAVYVDDALGLNL
jgi:hypothetical protein